LELAQHAFARRRREIFFTFFMMTLFDKALAASTAFGVRFGWVDNDCKNVLSCSVGRKGSVGHDAAIALSFCDILEVDIMIELKEPACESIGKRGQITK